MEDDRTDRGGVELPEAGAAKLLLKRARLSKFQPILFFLEEFQPILKRLRLMDGVNGRSARVGPSINPMHTKQEQEQKHK